MVQNISSEENLTMDFCERSLRVSTARSVYVSISILTFKHHILTN